MAYKRADQLRSLKG